MTKQDVESFLIEELKKKAALFGLKNYEASSATDLMKEGIYDSMSFVELIAGCEERFNIEIDLGRYEPGEFTLVHKLAEIVLEAKQN